MANTGSELESIRKQLLSGNVQSGSILAKVLDELPAQQLQELKVKAVDGMLGLELEKIAMSQRFQASSIEIKDFIERIKELEQATAGRISGYKAKGEFGTASGKTTIEAKKGCYIATAVYGSSYHEKVLLLQGFRDNYLLNNFCGYQFCRGYYKISPYLVKHFSRDPVKHFTKIILDIVCNFIENNVQQRK